MNEQLKLIEITTAELSRTQNSYGNLHPPDKAQVHHIRSIINNHKIISFCFFSNYYLWTTLPQYLMTTRHGTGRHRCHWSTSLLALIKSLLRLGTSRTRGMIFSLMEPAAILRELYHSDTLNLSSMTRKYYKMKQ